MSNAPKTTNAPVNPPMQSWKEKVFSADDIWQKVQEALENAGAEMPQTPRRPDVRAIVKNTSGAEARFLNPGDHSASKEESIPAAGDDTAVMIMFQGDTLEEQYDNAQALFKKYNLHETGMDENFIKAIRNGEASEFLKEAYGPAPFEGQAGKLVDVSWGKANGKTVDVEPKKGLSGAFGARAAATETVFFVQVPLFVQGSSTTPELIESAGIAVAVASDWQTGEVSTRPIAASVARDFYGEHCDNIPVVKVDMEGFLSEIDLKNGTVLTRPQEKDDFNGPKPAEANPM
jgi:hypothetical protein